MHRVSRDGAGLSALNTLNFGTGDALGFVFGEIDVRVRVAKQRDRFGRNPRQTNTAAAPTCLPRIGEISSGAPGITLLLVR